MNSLEKFKMREQITATSTANLEVMYNNSITNDWTKGAIAQELLMRKIAKIDNEIRAKQIEKLDMLFNIGEGEDE